MENEASSILNLIKWSTRMWSESLKVVSLQLIETHLRGWTETNEANMRSEGPLHFSATTLFIGSILLCNVGGQVNRCTYRAQPRDYFNQFFFRWWWLTWGAGSRCQSSMMRLPRSDSPFLQKGCAAELCLPIRWKGATLSTRHQRTRNITSLCLLSSVSEYSRSHALWHFFQGCINTTYITKDCPDG